MRPIRSFVLGIAGLCFACASMACSALTRPDEITITAEPVAAPAAPAPGLPANPALANPAVANAMQAGRAQSGG